MDQIIEISRKYHIEELEIKASIKKAEIFRKTRNFDSGIALLESLKNTERYPQLHVQKLGRFAALYAENGALTKDIQNDSIIRFIREGIQLAVKYNFKEEEAGMRNELGFRQSRERNFDAGLNNLRIASQLYKEIGDTLNEVSVLVNAGDFDSLYPILVDRVEETEWYGVRSNLYRIISAQFFVKGDIVSGSTWR